MYTVRIHSQLEDRLDAEFYNPQALKTVQKIDALGKTKRLGHLIAEGYRVVYHGTDSINGISEERLLPFLSPTQIDDQGSIDFSAADKLPLYYKDDYPKGLAIAGELLIEVKGNVSKVGVVPEEFPKNLMVSGSLYKASLKADTNSRYVLAFLKSKHGQILKNRLTSNTIINYIAKDALYSIPLFAANSYIQKYIGDKVRQAERLRAWAKLAETHVNQYHQKLVPQQTSLDFAKRVRVVSPARMSERLDAHFYPGVVDEYLRLHQGTFKQLGKLCTTIYNGQTQPETASLNSCKQITVTNLSSSFLGGTPRDVEAPVKKEKFLKAYDILMCNAAHNKSYIGKDLTFVHSEAAILPSTEVMTIRVDRNQVPASYVRAYLLTTLGYVQIQSTIRGITAHSYPDDMALLDIYVPDVADKDKGEWFACDEKLALAGKACEVATQLAHAAKFLVEALIEGLLTEAELIAAEQALQTGDDKSDRLILNRLKSNGVDGQGPALFSDLDALYSLLALAEVA